MIPNLAATVLAFRTMQRHLKAKSMIKSESQPKQQAKDKPSQKSKDISEEIFIDQDGNKSLN